MLKILKTNTIFRTASRGSAFATFFCLAVLLGAGLGLTGCSKNSHEVRSYTEIQRKASAVTSKKPETSASLSPDQMAMLNKMTGSSAKPDKVQWTTPEGWTESTGNSMRIATFKVTEGDDTAETSLVLLGGGGGIEENLIRWIGQIADGEPDRAKLLALLEESPTFQTEGGRSGILVDLASFAKEEDDADSMMTGIVPMDNQKLFVKMTGPKRLLAKQKEAFRALCDSLR